MLIWLLVLELIGLAAFPLLFRMLPGLPDRGFALAKTLALLLVAYIAWLLGSLHLLAFTPASVWLCAGLLIVAGGAGRLAQPAPSCWPSCGGGARRCWWPRACSCWRFWALC